MMVTRKPSSDRLVRALHFEQFEERVLLTVWSVSPVEDILPILNFMNESQVEGAVQPSVSEVVNRAVYRDLDGDQRVSLDDVLLTLGLSAVPAAEGETVLGDGGPTVAKGVGVAGDSLSDEYGGTYGDARNWVELLAEEADVDVGRHGDRDQPRGTGYEHNWAKSGATAESLLQQGQHTGLAGQIADGKVGFAVLFIGQNDFKPIPLVSAYAAIYGGFWTEQKIADYVDARFDNIETAVRTLAAEDGNLVVSNIVDYSVAAITRQLFPDAQKRERVTRVIDAVNSRIATLAWEQGAVLVDNFAFSKDFFGTNHRPIASQSIGGVQITNTSGSAATNAFYDGIHPHTVLQAGLANIFLTGLNIGYGANFDLFTEEQMVSMAGLAYGGQDTFGLDYVDYVVPPTAIWSNPGNPLDVDNDTHIVPRDVLLIINELNDPQYLPSTRRLPLPPPTGVPPPYLDVNGDHFCTPVDALVVINFLNGA